MACGDARGGMAALGNVIGDLDEDDACYVREGGSTRSSSGSSQRELPLLPPRHPHAPDPRYQLRPPLRHSIQSNAGEASSAQVRPQNYYNYSAFSSQNGRFGRQVRPDYQRQGTVPPGPPLRQYPKGYGSLERPRHNNQPLRQNIREAHPPQDHWAQEFRNRPFPNSQTQYNSNRRDSGHQIHGNYRNSLHGGPLYQNSLSANQRRASESQLMHRSPSQGRQMPQNHSRNDLQELEENPRDISMEENGPRNIERKPKLVELPARQTYDGRSENQSEMDSNRPDHNIDTIERNPNQAEPNKVVTKAVLTTSGCVETLSSSPEPRRPIFSFEEQRASPALLQRNTGTPGGRSVRDDGYCSAGGTPLSRGDAKSTKHGSVVTLTSYKKEPRVQLEEENLSKDSTLPVRNYNLKDGVEDGRETWGTGADFLLSIIGFAVDLANVWRFPYLCYRNGGGAFLIPYTLMLVFGALPLFYMELILGQYNRQGPISLWKICPLFKGVGFCAVTVAFYVSFYYNVIIGWAVYFLVSSAQTELPWLHCGNAWNTDRCWDGAGNVTNRTDLHFTTASEFFHRSVLEMQHSEGLHDLGLPKWQLALCLGAVYFTLYLSLFKGVKSSGKVVWATATLPYVVLSILLVRGLLLPGAARGIAYYLQPELARLKDTQVWVDAAVQIFYSVGAGFGVHLSYASYNTFHNNCYRDCLVTTLVNCFTSFFSGFVIFTYLGFMSHKQGVPISAVATEGPGLVFQVYPEAVATLPGASIWAMLFFFMLIMLGLDSGMGGLECVITGLLDEARSCGALWLRREHFTLVVVCISFCVACINVTPGGMYMFHLLDTYAAGISLLCSALFEALAVSWFYGLERFSDDVEEMLGFRPGIYWRVCWKFVSPTFIIGVVTFGLLYQQPLRYQQYLYPDWALVLGWGLALSSILMIPACAIYKLITTPGTFVQRVACCVSPESEHEAIRGGAPVTRFRWRHWLYV